MSMFLDFFVMGKCPSVKKICVGECPDGEMSCGEKSWWGNVLMGKFPTPVVDHVCSIFGKDCFVMCAKHGGFYVCF